MNVKIWNDPMIDVTNTKKVVGLSIGSVMFRKRRQGPAPSIIAAS